MHYRTTSRPLVARIPAGHARRVCRRTRRPTEHPNDAGQYVVAREPRDGHHQGRRQAKAGAPRRDQRITPPHRYLVVATYPSSEFGVDTTIVSANDTVSVSLTYRGNDFGVRAGSSVAQGLTDLAEARARWAARRATRYRLTVKMQCLCGFPPAGVTLEFLDDSLVATIDKRGRRHRPADPWLQEYSVPAMFAEVEDAIRQFERTLGVDYDPEYGIPIVIDTDVVFGLLDGGRRVIITNFRPMP